MNWEVRIRVLRNEALTDVEKDLCLEHVRKFHATSSYDLMLAKDGPINGVVLEATLDMYYSDAHDADTQKLLVALTALHTLLKGATLHVWDDYELIGWSKFAGRYDTTGSNDVPEFSLLRHPDFIQLSQLDYDFRFHREAVTHAASRIEAKQTDSQGALLTIHGDPRFVDDEQRGEKRQYFAAWVRNGAEVPLQISSVGATLLTAEGLAVEHTSTHLGMTVRGDARLLVRVPGPPSLRTIAETIALIAETELAFEHFLGHWTLDRATAPPSMQLKAVANEETSPFPVEVTLSGFIDTAHPDRDWRLVIELRPAAASAAARVELALDLVDNEGRTLATQEEFLDLEEGNLVATSIWQGAHELDAVARIELRAMFKVTQRVELGEYKLPPRGSLV